MVLVTLVNPAPLSADPGDLASSQNRYQAIRTGAMQLLRANEALERGDDKFRGHRVAAIRLINDALTELDRAVRFADNNPKAGEKGNPWFDADRGRLAAAQTRFPAIRNGTLRVIDAGRTLDQGFDRFGGHRVNALKTLNRALDELETAVKEAK
jgi:hypothetical protein